LGILSKDGGMAKSLPREVFGEFIGRTVVYIKSLSDKFTATDTPKHAKY
jgi:hypothetical protein